MTGVKGLSPKVDIFQYQTSSFQTTSSSFQLCPFSIRCGGYRNLAPPSLCPQLALVEKRSTHVLDHFCSRVDYQLPPMIVTSRPRNQLDERCLLHDLFVLSWRAGFQFLLPLRIGLCLSVVQTNCVPTQFRVIPEACSFDVAGCRHLSKRSELSVHISLALATRFVFLALDPGLVGGSRGGRGAWLKGLARAGAVFARPPGCIRRRPRNGSRGESFSAQGRVGSRERKLVSSRPIILRFPCF